MTTIDLRLGKAVYTSRAIVEMNKKSRLIWDSEIVIGVLHTSMKINKAHWSNPMNLAWV